MPLPILTVAQMREWERLTWATGQTELEVIRQVGRAVATQVLALTQRGDRILVLAGRGHNGDDARAARDHWPDRQCHMVDVLSPSEARDQVLGALREGPALVVDAMFGIGLSRPLDEEWSALVHMVNGSGIPVLAVDVPSGLNADTGQPQGAAIEAAVTLTVGAPKAGLLRSEAARFVGRLEVADQVGLVACPATSEIQWTIVGDFEGFPPRRAVCGHKGTFGHVGIVAGSLGFHGAAVLSCRGALRARPGLVSLVTPDNVYVPIASQLQSAMVHPWSDGFEFRENSTGYLIGPGLVAGRFPPELASFVRDLWSNSAAPVVADAGALELLPGGGALGGRIRVITPHPGEAAAILGCTAAEIQADRHAAVRELSRRYGGGWVVLKGHQTVVGQSEGPAYVNSSGNPGLAQGGSGDLLAGYLAGLLAQPTMQADPLTAIRFAVWQHGAAADALERRQPQWTIEDLALTIGSAGTSRRAG